jgi:imidazolonepropionase-like amidohydrolase
MTGVFALLLAGMAGAPLLFAAASPAPEPFYVRAGVLIDGTGAAPRHDVGIVIRGERIESVEPWSKVQPPKGARVVDLSGLTVLPGLIDCHVHLSMEVGKGWELEAIKGTTADAAILATVSAQRTLRAGFTTVRNLADRGGESVALRNAIDRGLVPGPRVITAREMLSITGGHGDWTNGFRPGLTLEGQDTGGTGVCDSPDACRAAVRYQIKYGADLIKISATGGVLSPGDEIGARQFSDAELQAIVAEAHALGKKVAAHAHGTAGIKAAVLAGVDSIEHGSILDDEAIRLMKEHGTYLVPTLLAGETVDERARAGALPDFAVAKAMKVRPLMQDSFRKAVAAGVRVAFGTDTGVSPHGQNAREFPLMVRSGMAPMDAILAATKNAADLLGRSADIGSIEAGKLADLVAVAGDPLKDIGVLGAPAAVYKSGAAVELAPAASGR